MDYRTFFISQGIFFVKLLFLALLLFGVHTYIIYFLVDQKIFFHPLWLVYCIHFLMVYTIYTFVNYRYFMGQTQVFNVFMLGTLLKMVLIVIFLLPVILSEMENKLPDVLNFFLPYFVFLAFEVYSITLFLQKK